MAKSLPAPTRQISGVTVTGLTSAQEHYCVLATTYDEQGRLPSIMDALREAYPNANENTLKGHATRMRQSRAVQARLEELRRQNWAAWCEKAKEKGIAVVAERIVRRNRDWERIEQVKEERILLANRIKRRIEQLEEELSNAADPAEKREIENRLDHWMEKQVTLIGLESGLYAHDIKMIGQGDNAREVEFVKLDKAMMDAQLDLEEATAKDLGQHKQIIDTNLNVKAYANFNPEDV